MGVVLISSMMTACTKKLDLTPTNNITAAQAYSTLAGYKQSLAKVYAAFALTGNTGGTGNPDIPTQIISDEGNSDFLRLYFNLQELTTDEAGWTWENDAGIQGLHEMSWSSINPIIDGLYYRAFFQITLANDFINQSSDANLSSRGLTGAAADSIHYYRAEARFLRAYQYWVLMDLFANPPFATENDPIGAFIPKQIQRKDLFTYIESELKAIETLTDGATCQRVRPCRPGSRMGIAGPALPQRTGLHGHRSLHRCYYLLQQNHQLQRQLFVAQQLHPANAGRQQPQYG